MTESPSPFIVSPLRSSRQPESFVDVTTRVHVGLARQHRDRCYVCKLRRVLYRITVESYPHPAQATEARCSECWGIRE